MFKPTSVRVARAAFVALACVATMAALIAGGPGATQRRTAVAENDESDDAFVFLPLQLHLAARPDLAPMPTPTPTGSGASNRTPTPSATQSLSADECEDPDDDWVFCDAFETGATWDGSIEHPVLVDDPGPFAALGNRVAQLRVPDGPGGRGLWKSLPSSDRLYARWYVMWEPGHDLTARHHGPGGLGADTAWYTGRSGIRPDGDEYFVSTLEAGTKPPHNVYAYTYYRGMYMDCADPNGRCWGDHFPCYAAPRYCTRPQYLPRAEQKGTVTGRWYCFEQLIDAGRPSLDGGDADGELDFWIDDLRIGPWTDLWWRTVPELKINFLWLYLYHHDDAHSVEGILIDNVVVSRSRIGCER